MGTKIKKALYVIFAATFIISILVGILGRVLCVRANDNYTELQPELTAPDIIARVIYNEEYGQLYVCYNDASYVNVYSEDGEFLWAVSTPYLRNAYFELSDGRLIVYNAEAYVYDASDGAFIALEDAEELGLDYDWENDVTGDIQAGEFYFDSFQVYRADENGELAVIVDRPDWYFIFDVSFFFTVALIGALGIGIIRLSDAVSEYRAIRGEGTERDRKARFIMKYSRVTVFVHIIYAVLNILSAFIGGALVVLIIPLALHFIVSSIVLQNMKDKLSVSENEMKALEIWFTFGFASFIAAFLSVIAVVMLIG